MRSGTARPGAAGWWRALTAAMVLLAVVCLTIWSDRQPTTSVDRPAGNPSPTQAAALQAPAAVVPGPESLRPVRLAIPDLGLDTRLITLGVRPDRTVEVPEDPDRAGWFRRGPAPGTLGSSVILGHVDSVDGPAVFAGLAGLTTGARITVRMDDGSVVVFKVHSVRAYANEGFPARRVYGSHGRSELNLVTCGGVYDASRGGYQSNVVVNARLM